MTAPMLGDGAQVGRMHDARTVEDSPKICGQSLRDTELLAWCGEVIWCSPTCPECYLTLIKIMDVHGP